ncbi:MAG: hypothetical protein KAJ49_07525 [Arcobacteraceae bacterium]|nr:hypothetical protein [Arcobacteraceae bacterium]
MITFGENKYKITLKYMDIGDDLLVIITGGKEHIGSVSLIDNGSYSALSKIGHKDEIISKFATDAISTLIKKDILVVCGIHLDDATQNDIKILMQNAQNCVEKFLVEYDLV